MNSIGYILVRELRVSFKDNPRLELKFYNFSPGRPIIMILVSNDRKCIIWDRLFFNFLDLVRSHKLWAVEVRIYNFLTDSSKCLIFRLWVKQVLSQTTCFLKFRFSLLLVKNREKIPKIRRRFASTHSSAMHCTELLRSVSRISRGLSLMLLLKNYSCL